MGKPTRFLDVSVTIQDGEFVCLIGPIRRWKDHVPEAFTREMTARAEIFTLDDWKINTISPQIHSPLSRRRRRVSDFKLLTDRPYLENVALALEILGKERTKFPVMSIKCLSYSGA